MIPPLDYAAHLLLRGVPELSLVQLRFLLFGPVSHRPDMRRKRLRGRIHHLTQAEQLRPRFVFGFRGDSLAFAEVAKRQNVMSWWVFRPVLQQREYVAGGRLIDCLEGPSGSSDDAAVNRGPIDAGATGRYSPSETGSSPDAPWTALMIVGKVVRSSHSSKLSSVTSG
jgi:hypothetical protein